MFLWLLQSTSDDHGLLHYTYIVCCRRTACEDEVVVYDSYRPWTVYPNFCFHHQGQTVHVWKWNCFDGMAEILYGAIWWNLYATENEMNDDFVTSRNFNRIKMLCTVIMLYARTRVTSFSLCMCLTLSSLQAPIGDCLLQCDMSAECHSGCTATWSRRMT